MGNCHNAVTQCPVLAQPDDVHALAVAECVRELGGRADIFDSALFPASSRASLSLENGSQALFEIEQRSLDASPRSTYDSVWLRRPRPHTVSPQYQSDVRGFAQSSSRVLLFGGIFATARVVINPPTANAGANYKPFQVALAARCGLKIPHTLVTNDPEDARRFVQRLDRSIYKVAATWRFDLKETRVVNKSDLQALDGIADCPVIFQELIEGRADIRATVVGNRIFAAEVDLGDMPPEQVDGRFRSRNFRECTLPESVQSSLLRFHREAGLIYGAYDFRVDRDGEYVFLEVNPEGQYLFVEIETEQKISFEIARVLCSPPPLG
jgi:hypothetical protein